MIIEFIDPDGLTKLVINKDKLIEAIIYGTLNSSRYKGTIVCIHRQLQKSSLDGKFLLIFSNNSKLYISKKLFYQV